MKALTIIILIILPLTGYCQTQLVDYIKNLEGVWIAEDYLYSFDKTRSSVESKNSFDPFVPVGLRINQLEVTDSFLNIGYSRLHDHSIYPEVSKYIVVDGDTIFEQGFFEINIKKRDSLNFYETSEIPFFNDESKAYFTWTLSPDTLLVLYRPASENKKEKTIKFKRISYSFDTKYLFPNPIYYYARMKTLVGNYILKDSVGNTIATDFIINPNGYTSGYLPFKDKIFYFSTDVYCGYPAKEDFVVFCSYSENLDQDCNTFVYKLRDENTIQFHKLKHVPDNEMNFIGDIMYKLIKK